MTENQGTGNEERGARQSHTCNLSNPKYLPTYRYGTYRLIDGTIIEITRLQASTGVIEAIKILKTDSTHLRVRMETEYLSVGRCKSETYQKTNNVSWKQFAWRSTLRNLVRRTIERIIKDESQMATDAREKNPNGKKSDEWRKIAAQKIPYAQGGHDAMNRLRKMEHGIYRLSIDDTIVEVKRHSTNHQNIVEVIETKNETLKDTRTFIFGWQIKKRNMPITNMDEITKEQARVLHAILREALQPYILATSKPNHSSS